MKNLLLIILGVFSAVFVGSTIAPMTTFTTGEIAGAIVSGGVVSSLFSGSISGVLMSSISLADASGIFTKRLVAMYKERVEVKSFLRSFFRVEESDTKELSIEVQRGTEKVAVDIFRGSEGNRNTMSNGTEKVIIPPYYKEFFDANELSFYDRLFGNQGGEVDVQTFNNWLGKVTEKLGLLQDKIERAYEVQCSQVLQTGVVELVSGQNIDFKRKAGSLVDLGAANYWADSGVDPVTSIIAGCKFLRTTGKASGARFNMILGETALVDLLNNTKVQNRGDIKDFNLSNINPPQRDSVGSAYHGFISAGSYIVDIWTYPEVRDVAGVSTPYIDDKNMIIIPQNPNFVLGFGSVPQIMRDTRNEAFPEFIVQQRGAYAIGNYVDPKVKNHIFEIASAGIAIPVGVDQIYTGQVVA